MKTKGKTQHFPYSALCQHYIFNKQRLSWIEIGWNHAKIPQASSCMPVETPSTDKL